MCFALYGHEMDKGYNITFQNDVVYQVAIAKGWIYED